MSGLPAAVLLVAVAAGCARVPIPFEIAYDPKAIDPRHSYAVAARILVGGRLTFINDTRHAVLTRGAPSTVDVEVVPVRTSPPSTPPGSSPPDALPGR
jgi:putative lipoprotein